MGQKVNPHGLRVGIIKDWDSRWFADKKEFGNLLVEDHNIRKLVKKEVALSGVPKVEIERSANRVKVTVFTAKPGMVIGKSGAGVEELRVKIEKLTGKKVIVNVEEVKRPDLSAQLVAFRRAMKQAMQRSLKAGAKGIKTAVSGRLGGADMARTEGYSEGTIPLQTLRADIEYGFAEADTTYGKLGVKVWLYKGEVLPGMKAAVIEERPAKKDRRNKKDNKKRFNKTGAKKEA